MKPRAAILRLWILTSLALGAGFLLRSRLLHPSREDGSYGAPENLLEQSATPASYAEVLPSAKTPEAKSCCDKPPTRAALLRGAPPAVSQ